MSDHTELTDRFDWMRNSGICSPTTRGLLDDAQAALEQTAKERDEAQRQLDGVQREWAYRGTKLRAVANERDALADRIERALSVLDDGRLNDRGQKRMMAHILSEGEPS